MKMHNYQDSAIPGFMIGIAICAIITLFHTCTSSCSRKITDQSISTDLETSIQVSSTSISSSDSSRSYLNSVSNRISSDYSNWKFNTTRIFYSAPDSLGNQYVTATESTQADFGSEHHDSISSATELQSSQGSTNVTETKDSLNAVSVHYKYKTITKTMPIPWYYRFSLYSSVFLLLIIILYMIYLKYRKRFIKRISYNTD